jgi:hypothetical protein
LLCPEVVISRPPSPSRSINAVNTAPSPRKPSYTSIQYSYTFPKIKNNYYYWLMGIVSDQGLYEGGMSGECEARFGNGSRLRASIGVGIRDKFWVERREIAQKYAIWVKRNTVLDATII